jgi:dTDP-4-amino-4,6-dideoxygalactose transaminase
MSTAIRRHLPLVDLAAQHSSIRAELDGAIAGVFDSCQFVLGSATAAFEADFARFCGVEHVVACANGTDALELCLAALGIGAGDEVVTVANTFAATAEAIVRAGATPRFVDVDPRTLLMDVDALGTAIGERTRAIIPVHLFGGCVDMPRLIDLATRRGLLVIEDAAQAHGAIVGGRRAGSWGHAASFSFYPGKNLGACGDAGAMATNDAALAASLRRLRDHGGLQKYEHDVVGRNSRMDGIQAAILNVKLPHLESWNARRRELAARYECRFDGMTGVRCVPPPAGFTEVRHLMVVEVDDRAHLQARLDAEDIATAVHYPRPLHQQPAFRNWAKEALPVAERAAARILSLPLYPQMAEADVDRVTDAVVAALRS